MRSIPSRVCPKCGGTIVKYGEYFRCNGGKHAQQYGWTMSIWLRDFPLKKNFQVKNKEEIMAAKTFPWGLSADEQYFIERVRMFEDKYKLFWPDGSAQFVADWNAGKVPDSVLDFDEWHFLVNEFAKEAN